MLNNQIKKQTKTLVDISPKKIYIKGDEHMGKVSMLQVIKDIKSHYWLKQ